MFERILYEVDKSDIITVHSIAFLMNWNNNGFFPFLWQLFLVPNEYNDFMYFFVLPPPAWINSDGIWSTPVALCFFNFSIASSTSGMSGSTVYTSLSLWLVLWLTFNKVLKNSSHLHNLLQLYSHVSLLHNRKVDSPSWIH